MQDFPSLKYFECLDEVSNNDITVMLKNGLIGLDCQVDLNETKDAICKLGSQIANLALRFPYNYDFVVKLRADDIRELERNSPKMK